MGPTFDWSELGETPLISCIMPTYGRPKLVPESVQLFLKQDYPNKELIILNDCPGQHYACSAPGVHVVNLPQRFTTLGEKRNACVELAEGAIIAVWDDDDVYLPWRLSYSIQKMLHLREPLYLAAEFWAYWGSADLVDNQAILDWISHPQALYLRQLWSAVGGYPLIQHGEDRGFFQRIMERLGTGWVAHAIDPIDRFLVMRGTSEYQHISIAGGRHPLDASPGQYAISPQPIADPVLRQAAQRLVLRRDAALRSNGRMEITTMQETPDCDIAYLDDLSPAEFRVGYGDLGLHGDLGYENKRVRIEGREFSHALSTHPPAEIRFVLDGSFESFSARVALNDDVPNGASSADFLVVADGNVAGIASNVRARGLPRTISADIRGAQELCLIARHHRWEYCHAVWGDPLVRRGGTSSELIDCLGRARIEVPEGIPAADTCIATVGSPGFEDWIDDLLGSVCANAQCPDALLAIFFYGVNDTIRRIAQKYEAVLIPCSPLSPLNPGCKSVLYSAGRVIPAARIICLDADTLVLDDLRTILASIDSHPPESVLACEEAIWTPNLEDALNSLYGGAAKDIPRLLNGYDQDEGRYPLVVNDGVFAGTRASLNNVDEVIRSLGTAAEWSQRYPPWRNQFVFNLALAHLKCGVVLDRRFNVQLVRDNLHGISLGKRTMASWNGRPAAIVHFNGGGRGKHSEMRGRYRNVLQPLTRSMAVRDHFSDFATALRRWTGQEGITRMAWTFYGTSDASSAIIRDSLDFTLLRTLYSLIRSNGCSRVIESGTARGVSTGCIAAAVCCREQAKVVSLDPYDYGGRDDFWSLLPDSINRCIEARRIDAISGMTEALRNGERYHAALLDSIHTREHVLQEFELAKQLVCSGGLILIHDPLLCTGTVGDAVDQIARDGYRVIRLWSADEGIQPDDRLGLAVVENRCFMG